MKLTDVEVASLIDALVHVDVAMGLTDVEVALLNGFAKEIRDRGYSWNSTDPGLLSHKVIEQLANN